MARATADAIKPPSDVEALTYTTQHHDRMLLEAREHDAAGQSIAAFRKRVEAAAAARWRAMKTANQEWYFQWTAEDHALDLEQARLEARLGAPATPMGPRTVRT